MSINTYLFDLDKTLIDIKIYAELYQPILNRIQKELNMSQEELNQKAESLKLIRNKYGRWDTGDLCKALNLLNLYYEELENHIDISPILNQDVHKVFENLKNKKIGIVSNSMHKTIQIYIRKYKLNVDFIFAKDDAGCKKTNPNYWTQLIEKFNLIPENCIVVGDNPVDDIEVPSKLGFNTFHIATSKDLIKVLNNKIA